MCLSLEQISKILFLEFLEIAMVNWILVSYFKLTMTNIIISYWRQSLLIPHAVLYLNIARRCHKYYELIKVIIA